MFSVMVQCCAKKKKLSDHDVEEMFKTWPKCQKKLEAEMKENLQLARQEVLLGGGLLLEDSAIDKLRELKYPNEWPKADSISSHMYPICARSGSFTPACCTPVCGNPLSDFSPLGSAVSAYFKLLKLLASTLTIVFFLAIPRIIINLYGNNSQATALSMLAATTLGNQGGVNGTVTITLPLVGTQDLGLVAVFYGMLDFISTLVLIAAYLWARVFVGIEDQQVREATLTVQSFTVYLPNISPKATEKAVRRWVSEVASSAVQERQLYALVAATNRSYAESEKPEVIACLKSTSPKELLASVFAVARVDIVAEHTLVRDLLGKIGTNKTLQARLEGEGKALSMVMHCRRKALRLKGRDMNCLMRQVLSRLEGMNSDAYSKLPETLVAAKLKALAEERKVRCLVSERLREHKPLGVPCAAFITFQHATARDAFLVLFAASNSSLGQVLQPYRHPSRLLLGRATRVLEPPAPTSVNYLNLHFTPLQRCGRSCLSTLLTMVLVLVSFGAILGLETGGQFLQQQITPVDCSERVTSILVAAYASKHTALDQSTLFSNFNASSAPMYCVCAQRGYAKATLEQLRADVYAPYCPFHACPRFAQLSGAEAKSWPVCVALTRIALVQGAYSFVAGQVISQVNHYMGLLLAFLTSFEGFHDSLQQQVSISSRNFPVAVFNTILLLVLMNARLGGVLQGLYPDFTSGWYAKVGADITMTVFTSAYQPYVPSAIISAFYVWFRWRDLNLPIVIGNLQKSEVVGALTGPSMNLGLRYSFAMLTFYSVVVFASNMPLITLAGALALWAAFFMDKLLLVRQFKKPPFFGAALARSAVEFMPPAIALHVAIAVYTISGMQMLAAPGAVAALVAGAASKGKTTSPSPSPSRRPGPLRRAAEPLEAEQGQEEAEPAAFFSLKNAPAVRSYETLEPETEPSRQHMTLKSGLTALLGGVAAAAAGAEGGGERALPAPQQQRALVGLTGSPAASPSAAPSWRSASITPSPTPTSASALADPYGRSGKGGKSSSFSGPAEDDNYFDYFYSARQTFDPPLPPVVSSTGCTCKSSCYLTPQLSGAYTSSCLVYNSSDLLLASPALPPASSSSTAAGGSNATASAAAAAAARASNCSLTSSSLRLNSRLGGLEAPCTLPFFGFSNSGCNCTSPCGFHKWAPPPVWRSAGYSDDYWGQVVFDNLRSCEVDPLCQGFTVAQGPSRSGAYDLCGSPRQYTCNGKLASYVTFCETYFYLPACNDPKKPLPAPVLQLGSLISPGGVPVTFSFIGPGFLQQLDPSYTAPQAPAINTDLSATFNCNPPNITTNSTGGPPSIFARLFYSSTLPLLVALCLTLALFFLGAFDALASVLATLAQTVLGAVFGREDRLAAVQKQAIDSATFIPKLNKRDTTGRKYSVPFALASRGKSGMYMGKPVSLVGQNFAMRAQAQLYQELNLLSTLEEADPRLTPEALVFAEADNVFHPSAPGLFFIVPYLWDEPKDLELDERAVPEGYKRRLSAWCKACNKQPGGLLERAKRPEEWKTWQWQPGQREEGADWIVRVNKGEGRGRARAEEERVEGGRGRKRSSEVRNPLNRSR